MLGLKESQSKPKIALINRAGNKSSFKEMKIIPKKTNSTTREYPRGLIKSKRKNEVSKSRVFSFKPFI